MGFESTGSLVTQSWPSAERLAHVSATPCHYVALSLDGLVEGSSVLPTMKRVAKSRLQLDLSWTPGLVEPGLQRAVEPQDGEPGLARNRLQGMYSPSSTSAQILCPQILSWAIFSFLSSSLDSLLKGLPRDHKE
jgi:hypothetical protein